MLLRKLEAYGFKSFAEKTEMEFKSGITAIVGPNGSGKSNISDAVRWVLGEQNIRNLRGSKMEDVIFSGSAKRRQLGVAEVSLVFDNSDGTLPLDYSEVTITRRVFRSGDGEYYINKTACRLKDIHDLLMDAGLSRESMTVISQNKVDEVLNSKPDERRQLFEEAAGIMKYKNRKREAVRKLEDTEQNLTRVFDITNEIEGQLEPMAESAERTTRYNELAADLKACQVTLLLQRLIHAEINAQGVREEQATLTETELAVSSRLSIAETEREKLTDELAGKDEAARTVESAISQTVTEIERLDGRGAVLGERVEQEQRNLDRISQETNRLENDRNEQLGKLAEWQQALESRQQAKLDLEDQQAAKNDEYQTAVNSYNEIEAAIEAAKDATFGHLQELVTQKNTLRTLERDQETLRQRQTSLIREQDKYKAELTQTETSSQETAATLARIRGEIVAADDRLSEMATCRQKFEEQLAGMNMREKRLNGKLGEHASRLKVLEDMQEEYEGFGKGPKTVLKANAPWRNGIFGAVAEVINVRDEYLTAIEIALGGALQHIIVDKDDTAKAAVEFLKQRQGGRATFLPLNTLKPNRPRDGESMAAHSAGALGFASELVSCEARYRPAIEFLLARTVVANDMDAALRIARQNGHGVKIVTLDGQLINPGGSITGGSVGRREASFLGRNNEISAMRETLHSLEAELAEVRAGIGRLQTEMAAAETEAAGLKTERQSLAVRSAEAAIHMEKAQQEIGRLQTAVATFAAEMQGFVEEAASVEVKMAAAAETIRQMENRDADHKQKIANQQEALKQAQLARDALSETLTDLKIKLSSLEQEISSIRGNCENHRQAESRLARQRQTLEAEKTRAQSEIDRAQAELAQVNEQKDKLAAAKLSQQAQRDELAKEKLGVIARQQKLDREIRDLRRRQATAQTRLHELEVAVTRFDYDITHCQEQLTDHFALSRSEAEALALPDDTERLGERIKQLETDIELLGPVNPAAIEEYTRIKERYEFLKTQYQDLTAAKDYLMTIIKDIDNTMAKQFRAAFTQINEHFGELFVRLFGGGKAQLELADPNDILNTGIEIIVQPPGKKQQNLALLSGGERALTVIALLFSFLTFRPTPFCVLDEIDAALDEANVQRFSEFLRDYSQETQFIIVTHRKGTMEVADVMHGVTMEESGVSKLISVKFMDKAG